MSRSFVIELKAFIRGYEPFVLESGTELCKLAQACGNSAVTAMTTAKREEARHSRSNRITTYFISTLSSDGGSVFFLEEDEVLPLVMAAVFCLVENELNRQLLMI